MKEEEIIKKIRKNDDDSILFRVRDGHKKFREGSIKNNNNLWKKVILLDDVPLITLSEKKYPMCSSIIKMMEGRSAVDKSIQDKININIPVKNVEEGFKKLEPFLSLFDDGYYELRELEMIPTDGEDNYFWSFGRRGRYYNASSDIYYRGKHINGFPKFLIPSEGIECLDENRVNYYRDKIKSGEELIGIALELKGFMALLLDGHHKATAAYLEGKNMKCLTIKSCEKQADIIDMTKGKYEKDNLADVKTIFIDKPKEVFPDYKAIALSGNNIDTSRERIDKLFMFESNHPIEGLQKILYYLTIHDKERAKKLCFEILEKSDFQIMWTECLYYLSRYKDKEVNKLFKNIMGNSNMQYSKNYENNLSIVQSYLSNYIN